MTKSSKKPKNFVLPSVYDSYAISCNGSLYYFGNGFLNNKRQRNPYPYATDVTKIISRAAKMLLKGKKSLYKKRNIVIYKAGNNEILSEIEKSIKSKIALFLLADIDENFKLPYYSWYYNQSKKPKDACIIFENSFNKFSYSAYYGVTKHKKQMNIIHKVLKSLGIKVSKNYEKSAFLFKSQEDMNLARLTIPEFSKRIWSIMVINDFKDKIKEMEEYISKHVTVVSAHDYMVQK